MESSHSFIGTEEVQGCDVNSNRLLMEENLNIATMSDSQFSESLEALIDLPYPFYTTTSITTNNSSSSGDLPTCFEVDDNESVVKGQPVEVNDASYPTSFQSINTSGNCTMQQSIPQVSTATIAATPMPPTNFFQQQQQPPLMMPLNVGFDPNAFMAAAAQNYVTMPPLTLQQSIEAFGRSMASNQHQMYQLPSSIATPFVSTMSVPVVPSSVSSLVAPVTGSCTSIASLPSKRGHNAIGSTCPISEDECDFRKRKADRNAREQQRAQQVTDQISHLRDLIVRSGVALDKIDKFSTLIAVEKYIRNLQSKSQELKDEHEKLLATLQQTSENVNGPYATAAAAVTASPSTPIAVSSAGEETSRTQDSSDQEEDDSEGDVPFVKEINYKWIFACCPFASSIASIDGRFLDCNKEFETMTGYSRAELLPLEHQHSASNSEKSTTKASSEPTSKTPPNTLSTMKKTRNMSIFNILHRECIERVFCEMSKVLQKCNVDMEDDSNSGNNHPIDGDNPSNDVIVEEVDLCKRSNQKATIRITLVRSPKGLPRFFNCLLIPSQSSGTTQS